MNWGVELLQSLPYHLAMAPALEHWAPKIGASDEARTRYLHLGKVALYQMSYTRSDKWYYSTHSPFVN